MGGVKNSQMGTLVVTSERIIFTDTKFAGLAREKQMMNKDRVRVSTATEEYVFNDC